MHSPTLEGGACRRTFLKQVGLTIGTAATCSTHCARAQDHSQPDLAGAIGLTTGGLNHQRRRGELTLRSLPRFVRGELGLQLIDLNSRWLEGYQSSYLQQVRGIADEVGCYFTNLKVNHLFGDLYSPGQRERKRAHANARLLIDVAKQLGTRWIRFTFPSRQVLGSPLDPVAHRELAAYADQQGIQLLVENLGWLSRDAQSVEQLVASIGRHAAPCPDTGNWSDELRYKGLKHSFVGAASCDFKALEMGPQFEHPAYDLERCFRIGWSAGFRGPWVIEHSNEHTSEFVRETLYLRRRLEHWTAGTN